MRDDDCLPNSCHYNVMIQGFLRNRYILEATQLVAEMVDIEAMDTNSGEGQQEDMRAVDTVNGQSDKGRDESKTYASVAAQSTLHGSSTKSPSAFVDEEVVVLDEDVILQRDGNIPSIQFSPRVHDQVDRNLRNAIIFRLLGKTIGFRSLWNRIHALWKPVGELQLVDLDNNYFLVRFTDAGDYSKVLTQGPWTIFGNYLTVQPWSRGFSTSEKHPSKVVVWVRLPGLPFRYYTKSLFRHIATLIGTVVKIDYNTQTGECGKFARLSLLVDLNKPLLSCFQIYGTLQKLEYESLQNICYTCGIYGHLKEFCATHKNQSAENVVVERVEANIDQEEITADNLFGPWMVVEHRRRRSTMDSRLNVDRYATGSSGGGSRFGVLQAEVAEVSNQRGDVLQDAVVQDQQVLQLQQSKLNRVVGNNNGPKKNMTYLESDPEKKKKLTVSGPSSVQFIPSLGGKEASSLIHKPRIGTGSHDAIIITKHGIIENGASGSKGRRSRNVGFKSVLGTVGRSLKGRRLAETRELNGREVSDFITELSGRLDNLQDPILHHHSSADKAMEVGYIRIADAENVSFDSDSRYNEEHGADVALGVASMAFRSQLRTFVHEQHADVVGLLEPRVSGQCSDKIIAHMGFPNSYRVEAHGFSGGIWLLWQDTVTIEVLQISNQFINVFVRYRNGNHNFQLIVVYASPNAAKRKHIWQQLTALEPSSDIPSVLGEASVYHLDRIGSDHCPIDLRLMAQTPIPVHRSF
ncbi:hypothetical protein GQ457_07G015390 [Hibiscus cannabinus]